jgi:hypothetical protein
LLHGKKKTSLATLACRAPLELEGQARRHCGRVTAVPARCFLLKLEVVDIRVGIHIQPTARLMLRIVNIISVISPFCFVGMLRPAEEYR